MDTNGDLRAVLDKWREFAHNYDLPCDADKAFDECWDALATALEQLESARQSLEVAERLRDGPGLLWNMAATRIGEDSRWPKTILGAAVTKFLLANGKSVPYDDDPDVASALAREHPANSGMKEENP